MLSTARMFVGHIDRQTIIADQPVLVVDGDAILNFFSRVEDATDFLVRTKNDTAIILRHNGRNWDIWAQPTATVPPT